MLLIRVTEGRQGFEPGAPVTSVSRNKWEGRQKGGIARVVVGIDARNEEKITVAGVCVRACTTHVLPVEPYVVISAIPRLLLHLSFLFGRMSALPAEEKCNVRITTYIQSSDKSSRGGRIAVWIVVKRCFVGPSFSGIAGTMYTWTFLTECHEQKIRYFCETFARGKFYALIHCC